MFPHLVSRYFLFGVTYLVSSVGSLFLVLTIWGKASCVYDPGGLSDESTCIMLCKVYFGHCIAFLSGATVEATEASTVGTVSSALCFVHLAPFVYYYYCLCYCYYCLLPLLSTISSYLSSL